MNARFRAKTPARGTFGDPRRRVGTLTNHTKLLVCAYAFAWAIEGSETTISYLGSVRPYA